MLNLFNMSGQWKETKKMEVSMSKPRTDPYFSFLLDALLDVQCYPASLFIGGISDTCLWSRSKTRCAFLHISQCNLNPRLGHYKSRHKSYATLGVLQKCHFWGGVWPMDRSAASSWEQGDRYVCWPILVRTVVSWRDSVAEDIGCKSEQICNGEI